MDDPTRALLGSQPPEEPQDSTPTGNTAPQEAPTVGAAGGTASDAGRPSRDPKFIGDAMRTLYRSGATSIERGDATRVIGRTEKESVRPAPTSTPPPGAPKTNSVPAGPRVDVTLWVVLALGLFAIAGVMLSGAL